MSEKRLSEQTNMHPNEPSTTSSLPDLGFLGTDYTEYRNLDNPDEPIDAINHHMWRHMGSFIQVSSTGFFKEGSGFQNFQSGFNNYCLFITLGGQGRACYRNI